MKVFVLFASLFLFSIANAEIEADTVSLKWVQSISIDTSKKIQGTKIGGLSGLVFKDSELFAISDDRGRFGDPRIINFKLTNIQTKTGSTQFEVVPQRAISLFKKKKGMKILDLEALAPYKDGWLISSEGDWNTKPKLDPEILLVEKKEIVQKIQLPNEYFPKFEGKQTAGLYNNKAFEGMFFDSGDQRLYLVSESGLFQDKEGDTVYHILEYTNKNGKFILDKKSKIDFTNLVQGSSLYNGASEFIKIGEGKFLLLNRAVMPALSLQYSNTIWLIKRKTEKDKWEIKGKYELNNGSESEELNQNYEGMTVFDLKGKRYLVLVSDDNFNKFEKTVFSFFELEVK